MQTDCYTDCKLLMQSGVKHEKTTVIWQTTHTTLMTLEQPLIIQSLSRMEVAFQGTFLALQQEKDITRLQEEEKELTRQKEVEG